MFASTILPKLSRVCPRQRLGIWRSVSLGRGATLPIGQGGRLLLKMPKAAATIKLTTQWVDSCKIGIRRHKVRSADLTGGDLGVSADRDYLDPLGLALVVDEVHGEVTVVHDEEKGEHGPYLIEAEIPELFSVDVSLASGSISLARKMKGSCRIYVGEGNIEVGIIRGEDIVLSTSCGHVHVDELEGKVDIAATTDVSARLINGSQVQIAAAGAAGDEASVKIGGLYSSGARISSTGDITVSTSHGLISAHTEGSLGAVALSSVSGAFQVYTGSTRYSSYLEDYWPRGDRLSAANAVGQGDARIHVDALEDGTSNHVRSDMGDISLSVSQEVQANIDIKGKINELPSSFEGLAEPCQAVGTIDRREIQAPNPYGSVANEGRGKIDLAGARHQSLRQYFKTSAKPNTPPTISVSSAGGSIRMETLSWADNIVRKFKTGR